ncbi:L,D-transpeptidase family protein [Conexibacter sp. DBS9H8]|uniref:L,D-transpeptidase family protein n=1 Tax=Conexibacter sp. DBS9H8 TaxID=2937801 RepID=UPI002010B32B|nr:L,D-transpeptidase family protein [Conexibacter sp. DBS9H8]
MSQPQPLTLGPGPSDRRWVPRIVALTALALPVIAAVVVGVLITTSTPALRSSPTALAGLTLPFGGARVTHVAAVVGREQKNLPVRLVGDEVWPVGTVGAGQPVTVVVTLRRPGWNAWFAGADTKLTLTETTPVARLTNSYLTLAKGEPLQLHFTAPVRVFADAVSGAALRTRRFRTPRASVAVTPNASAGTLRVAGAPRTWERPQVQTVSWFPAGSAATAVATPAPGSTLAPQSSITLTFSTPVAKALSGHLPAVTPSGVGSWRTLNSHAIQFVPSGYGYGLGAQVQVALPAGVHLVGGTGDPVGTWSVPAGSTTRLQQLLAELGYLPVSYTPAGAHVAGTVSAQEAAAINPPSGHWAWRWPNTPATLKAQWQPGAYNEITKAAVMSFENNQGLTVDGVDGPQVWKALLAADLAHQTNSFGYTFVFVHEANSGEYEQTWHNGKIVTTGPVNTGVAAAGGTQTGVFAVFEHLPVTTMSGVNPNGTHYHDPGIPDVSYFNGGDALHGFIRASYGFPQSDGCVEMPFSEAAAVYPYTPIGTVVDVSTA